MALKHRIRRKLRRKSPAVRRKISTRSSAVKSDTNDASNLMIGGAHDPAEKSADHMAARVLSAPGLLSNGGNVGPGTNSAVHRKCASCKAEEKVSRKAAAGIVAPGAASSPASKTAAKAIGSLGGGRGLNRSEKAFFEPRFGRDFSGIRIHEDTKADRANRAIDARAFTKGNDVAFAKGQRTKSTMAHELAHVVQDGGAARRKIHRFIQPGSEASVEMTDTLETDYGINSVVTDGAILSTDVSSASTDIKTEIVESMLNSQRLFRLKGGSINEVEDSLATHVRARSDIVDFAKNIRIGFATGKPRLDDAKWKTFNDEYDKVEAEIDQNLKDAGKTESERAAYLKSKMILIMIAAMNNQIKESELNEMLDDIELKSKSYDVLKDPTKARPYAMACFRASLVVMAGGARSALNISFLDGVAGTKMNMSALTWSDWIPGDWGYISNQGAGTIKAGHEGENIISIGQSQFWAHYDPDNPIRSLIELFNMVEGWNGKAQLEPTRTAPTVGLG